MRLTEINKWNYEQIKIVGKILDLKIPKKFNWRAYCECLRKMSSVNSNDDRNQFFIWNISFTLKIYHKNFSLNLLNDPTEFLISNKKINAVCYYWCLYNYHTLQNILFLLIISDILIVYWYIWTKKTYLV